MKSLKHNALMNAVLSVSSIIFPLITYPYVARVLGPEPNGRLAFAQSVINYFSLFATLGITTYGIRACAKARDNKDELSKNVHELLLINVFTTSIVLIVLGLAIVFSSRLRTEYILLIIYSLQMVLNVAGLNWLYSALEKYDYITYRSIAFKFLSLVLMFIFIHRPEDCYKYAFFTVLANVGSNILNIIRSRRYINYKWYGIKNYRLKRHIVPTLTLFVTMLAVNIYTNLDNVMLGYIKNDYHVGIYHTAVRIQTILTSLVTSVGNVLMPRLSNCVERKDMKEFNRIIRASYQALLMISLPICVYFVLFAKEGVLLIAGSEYMDAIIPMKIIMPIVVTTALSNIIGMQIFIPLGRENAFMKAVMCGAVTDLVLNALLMPKYAAAGAAIATLLAQMVQFTVQAIQAKEYILKIFDIKATLQIILVTAMASVPSVLIGGVLKANTFVVLCVTAAIFFSIYAVLLWIMDYNSFTGTVEQFTKGKIKRHRG